MKDFLRIANRYRFLLKAVAVFLWLVVGASVLFTLIVSLGIPRQYNALAAALIAASGTIFAGWLAWRGIREQIAKQDELQGRNEVQGMNLIQNALIDFLDVIDEIWFGVDLALNENNNQQERMNAIGYVTFLTPDVPLARIATIEGFQPYLGPENRFRLNRLVSYLRFVERAIKELADAAPAENLQALLGRIATLHLTLSHVAFFLEQFDPVYGEWFTERTKSNVAPHPMTEEMQARRQLWIAQHGEF